MVDPTCEAETVVFYRRSELSGVEVRTVRNSGRTWHCYSTDFEFLAPSTWRGEITHRKRTRLVEAGSVLCAHPGDVFTAHRVHTAGSGSSLLIEARVLSDYAAEQDLSLKQLKLRPFSRMSAALRSRLSNVFEALPSQGAMQVQTSFVEFIASMVDELLDQSSARLLPSDSDAAAAERILECLKCDTTENLDLTLLAKHVGLSRFQALRVFKRQYGLPPHNYQLRVRLGLAQRLLRQGQKPALVAAEFGFADQSHFTRHFKRLMGVTPAQYARVGAKRGHMQGAAASS